MKKVLLVLALALICMCAIHAESSKHKVKIEINASNITLLQATELEGKVRAIQIFSTDGKPVNMDIRVKVGD